MKDLIKGSYEALNLPAIPIERNCQDHTLINIYKKLMKTDYYAAVDVSTCEKLACLIMFHYGLMTPRQFSLVMPDAYKYGLSNMQSRAKMPTLIKTEMLYPDVKACYSLTKEKYDDISGNLPESYLVANGLSFSPVSNKQLEHSVALLDLPYLLLGCESSIPFNLRNARLNKGSSIADCIDKSISDKNTSAMKNTDDIVPDAILEFDGSYIFVEQDMSTEYLPTISEKHLNYGKYFSERANSGDSESAVTTIVFTLSLTSKDSSHDSMSRSYSHTVKNLQAFAEDSFIETLDVLKERLLQMTEKNPKIRRYKEMLLTLDAVADRHDGELAGLGIGELRTFCDDIIEENQVYRQSKDRQKLQNRENQIKKTFMDLITSIDGQELRESILNGLSYVITKDVETVYRYVFPYESGFISDVANTLQKLFFKGRDVSFGIAPYRVLNVTQTLAYKFRNLIGFKDDLTNRMLLFAFLADISYDAGSRYRVSYFLRNYNACMGRLEAVLLVKNKEDAVKFCEETGCIRKYCLAENVAIPNSAYKLGIWFIDYNANPERLFTVDTFGKIMYYEEAPYNDKF